MNERERTRLEQLRPEDGAFTLFEGDPQAAIKKFPANVNVAIALAWATQERVPRGASPAERSAALDRALKRVKVSIEADPQATQSRHVIRASGTAGDYEFTLENAPSPSNPRTSGLTAMSVAHNIREILI
ncbi:MAG: aspartate dehydrogenase domain-containing protein [Gulosibacter sp.]|uniref:aspartate dehydrogenase domain-containing protein n=1 Tax=Gulosibacter sp. TaxID=2817531 RepID=UPI003F8F1974